MSMDNEKGLYSKYLVYDAGGEEPLEDLFPYGDVFVLRPEVDDVALLALKVYADTTKNTKLSRDLWRWIAEIESKK